MSLGGSPGDLGSTVYYQEALAPTGTSDDSAVINAAIARMAAVGGIVRLRGAYAITSHIIALDGATVDGGHPDVTTITANIPTGGDETVSTVFLTQPTNVGTACALASDIAYGDHTIVVATPPALTGEKWVRISNGNDNVMITRRVLSSSGSAPSITLTLDAPILFGPLPHGGAHPYGVVPFEPTAPTIRNLTIAGAFDRGLELGSFHGKVENVRVRGTRAGHTGLSVDNGGRGFKVRRLDVDGGTAGALYGAFCEANEDGIWEQITATRCVAGVCAYQSRNTTWRKLALTGNTTGMLVDTNIAQAPWSSDGCVVEDSNLSGNSYGAYLDDTSHGWTFKKVTFANNSANNVLATPTTPNSLNGDNTFEDCTFVGSAVSVLSTMPDTAIVGGSITGASGNAVQTAGARARVTRVHIFGNTGFAIYATGGDVTADGNHYADNGGGSPGNTIGGGVQTINAAIARMMGGKYATSTDINARAIDAQGTSRVTVRSMAVAMGGASGNRQYFVVTQDSAQVDVRDCGKVTGSGPCDGFVTNGGGTIFYDETTDVSTLAVPVALGTATTTNLQKTTYTAA
jgi:hypothetical protein